MKILITGNTGYIGSVLERFLEERSYEVIGLDCRYYEGSEFYAEDTHPSKQIKKDIRDIKEKDLREVEAIIHLAALSNDPLGEINPLLTHEINYLASVRLAELAKKIGIKRFIFSSSCSLYGIAENDKPVAEEGIVNPITSYAKAKIEAEMAISKLAKKNFCPVFMRNATVYGLSPYLRLDLVVNNLVAWAYLTGKITIMSDGTPWRPIIHIEDLCRAFLAILEAPTDLVYNQIFNVGIDEENYQIEDIANEIEKILPNTAVEILNRTGPDERTYRVDFSKIKRTINQFKPVWDLKKGIEELYSAYKNFGLTRKDFDSNKYFRIRWIKYLLESKKLDRNLRYLKKK